ncbi:MAG: tetratricopeptide repeat protein [Verrucomicrobiae bacterium]|nr:tetratricopeptide repeat protein [Verrucomicrobiae bacterium]
MKKSLLIFRLGLIVLTLAVFWPMRDAEFIHLDDPVHVSGNPNLQGGLTWPSIKWAFEAHLVIKTFYLDYWQPVTVLSRLIDVSLFGFNAPAHHLMNVFYHLINTLLAFEVFRRILPKGDEPGRQIWCCAWMAAMFGIHPLHVESVAWVTERKDVLFGMFWLLTTWAYIRYIAKPGWFRYGWVVFFFAMGLMSKPMIMTLPVILLVLDWWPLRRIHSGIAWPDLRRIFLEKLPLFLLAALSFYLIWRLHGKSVNSGGWALTVEKIVVAYGCYLKAAFWPTGLSIWHSPIPYPPFELFLLSAVVLGGVSKWVWDERLLRPWLLTGWVWFLIGLAPVVSLREAAWAERFMYIPLVGLFIMVAGWWLGWVALWAKRVALGAGLFTVLGGGWMAYSYAQQWQDGEKLWRHVMESTNKDIAAREGLCLALTTKGAFREAYALLEETVRIDAGNVRSLTVLGRLKILRGQYRESVRCFEQAITVFPNWDEPYAGLADAFLRMDRPKDAVTWYKKAMAIEPDYAPWHLNLGVLLVNSGRVEEGVEQLREAARLKPDYSAAVYNLGNVLKRQKKHDEAAVYLQRTLKLEPGHLLGLKELAALHLERNWPRRQPQRALELAEMGCEVSKGSDAESYRLLAAACMEVGQKERAVWALRKAAELREMEKEEKKKKATLPPKDRFRWERIANKPQ